MRSNPSSSSTVARPAPRRTGRTRRGSAIMWVGLTSPVALAFASLLIDWGRVQLVRCQLQQAAESAARHATNSLCGDSAVARTAAIDLAKLNMADGQPIVLRDSDVELGTWDTTAGTFRAYSGAQEAMADAVRVTARRESSRGTGVPMIFGALTGRTTADIQASAITTLELEGYGVIGLDWIKMGGNSTASYRSDGGANATGAWGNVASNGDITLSGSSFINGHARPGVHGYVYGGDKRVSGTIRQLKTPLNFPNGSAGTVAQFNDNAAIPLSYMKGLDLTLSSSDSLSLPGGNYYLEDVDIKGTLKFTGPTTLYCYGSFTLWAKALTAANLPKNLTIVMCPGPNGAAPGALTVWSTSALYASLYAPQSPIILGGTGDIYGSVLGKSVDMSGTSAIFYDVTLKAHGIGVSLVR